MPWSQAFLLAPIARFRQSALSTRLVVVCPARWRTRQALSASAVKPERSTVPSEAAQARATRWAEGARKHSSGLHAPDSGILLILAALIGASGGLGVTAFKTAIRLVSDIGYGDVVAGALLPFVGSLNLIAVPTIGGVCVSLLRIQFGPFDGGIEAMLKSMEKAQRFDGIRSFIKAAAAVFTLGSGCSLGPEGPAVEIGASFARLVPQWVTENLQLRLTSERLRQLFACGCAAGVAAGFNAPFAGIFFAYEIAQRAGGGHSELGAGAGSTAPALLIASAMSSLIARLGLGERPAFSIPTYDLRNPLLELPLYLGLGLLAGWTSLGFRKALLFGQQLYDQPWLRQVPRSWRPLVGGLLNGMVGFAFPQILFFGYDMLDALLADTNFSIPLLAGLLILKPVMTAASLGSGLVGGTFAPALFVGANLGALYCKSIEWTSDWFVSVVFKTLGATPASALSGSIPIAGPPAYAMVGMAAVLAGMFRAPLTACLLLFEMTRDYRIILPLMAGVGISVWIADDAGSTTQPAVASLAEKREGPSPLYLGIRPDAEFRAVASQLTVRDAVTSIEPLYLDARQCAAEALQCFRERDHTCILVTTTEAEAKIVGILTVQDLLRAKLEYGSLQEVALADICSSDFQLVSEEEPLVRVLDILESQAMPLVPVVAGTRVDEQAAAEVPNGAFSSGQGVRASLHVCGFVDLASIERAVQFSRLLGTDSNQVDTK